MCWDQTVFQGSQQVDAGEDVAVVDSQLQLAEELAKGPALQQVFSNAGGSTSIKSMLAITRFRMITLVAVAVFILGALRITEMTVVLPTSPTAQVPEYTAGRST